MIGKNPSPVIAKSRELAVQRVEEVTASPEVNKIYDGKVAKITDFGAGSHVNDNKTRKIKDVAKNSAKNAKFGKLIYRITQFYKPKNILELGTSLGISTLYLAKANKDTRLKSPATILKYNVIIVKPITIKNTEVINEFRLDILLVGRGLSLVLSILLSKSFSRI